MSLERTLQNCTRNMDVVDIKNGLLHGIEFIKQSASKTMEMSIQLLKKSIKHKLRKMTVDKQTELVNTRTEIINNAYRSFLINMGLLQSSIENEMNTTDMELNYDSIVRFLGVKVNWAPLIEAAYDEYDKLNSITQRRHEINMTDDAHKPLLVKAIFDLVWYNRIIFYEKSDQLHPTKTQVKKYINNHFECERDFETNPVLESEMFNSAVPKHKSVKKLTGGNLIGKRVFFYETPTTHRGSPIRIDGIAKEIEPSGLLTISMADEFLTRNITIIDADGLEHLKNEDSVYLNTDFKEIPKGPRMNIWGNIVESPGNIFASMRRGKSPPQIDDGPGVSMLELYQDPRLAARKPLSAARMSSLAARMSSPAASMSPEIEIMPNSPPEYSSLFSGPNEPQQMMKVVHPEYNSRMSPTGFILSINKKHGRSSNSRSSSRSSSPNATRRKIQKTSPKSKGGKKNCGTRKRGRKFTKKI